METELDKIEEGERRTGARCSSDSTVRSRIARSERTSKALIAEAHDLSALAKERCPTCGGKLVPHGRILRAVPGVREPPEDVQVHAPAAW